MKKYKAKLLVMLIIIISGSCTKNINNNSEMIITSSNLEEVPDQNVTKEILAEDIDIQTEDKLSSTYSEGTGDGYSWRKREINYNTENEIITKDILLSTLWVLGKVDSYQSRLVFYTDDKFKIGTLQSGVLLYGEFEIIDESTVLLNVIDLYSEESTSPITNSLLKINKTELVFHIDKSLFNEQHYIEDTKNKMKWFAIGSKPKDNSIFHIQNTEVERYSQTCIVTENVKLRTGPGINYDAITLNKYTDESWAIELNYIPVGEKIYVQARTTESYKVSDWNAKWYYISYPVYVGSIDAWVYGEFVAPYDENTSDKYKKKNMEEWSYIRTGIK